MAVRRLTATVDHSASAASVKPVISSTYIRPVQPTQDGLQNPAILHRQIVDLQNSLTEVTQAQRTHPEQDGLQVWTNVACPSSGTVRINHGLGRMAGWYLTDWVNAGNVMPRLSRNTTLSNDSVLVLNSSVAGTATIRVF